MYCLARLKVLESAYRRHKSEFFNTSAKRKFAGIKVLVRSYLY